MASADRNRPSKRVRGMLGSSTADEFPTFGDFAPPTTRSMVDEFLGADAGSVLDGDVGAVQSQRIAKLVRSGKWDPAIKKPHGGHRFGTGWGKSEFPFGWGEIEVVEWVCALIDNPSHARPHRQGFVLVGTYRGVGGELKLSRVGGRFWFIGTAHPVS